MLPSQRDEAVELGPERQRQHGGPDPPLEAEQRVGHRPAVVHPAQHVVLRAPGVGEEDLAEVALAGDVDDRADLDPGLVHRYQHERDALVLGHVGVGAAQGEDHVPVQAGAGPDLLAVDHPFVAVELGPAPEVGQIGAGVRLGVALAPDVGAVEDAGDVVLLLLLGAPVEDGVADHRDAEPVVGAHGRHAPLGELLVEDRVLELGQPGSAVLRRPVGREELVLAQDLPPLLLPAEPLLLVGDGADTSPVVGQVLVEEVVHPLPEGLALGRVGEVHGPDGTTGRAAARNAGPVRGNSRISKIL